MTWIPAADYGRRVGVGKSRMSAYLANGMPWVAGKDAEGRRDCKLVNIVEADTWRLANVEARIGADGSLRGLSIAGGDDPLVDVFEACAEDLVEEGVRDQVLPPAAARLPAPPPPPRGSTAKPGAPPSSQPAGGGGSATQNAMTRVAEAKATAAEADAHIKHLKMLAAEGALLDRKAAIGAHVAFVSKVGTMIDRMPANLASLVAAELGVSEHAAFKVLTDTVALQLREDLASSARSTADAAARKRRG